MTTRMISLFLAWGFVSACGGDDDGGGGGSGVDAELSVTELDDAEVTSFCEWAFDIMGGDGASEDCGDFTFEVAPVAECEDDFSALPDTCSELTVAYMESCFEAWAEDLCGFGGSACADYLECAGQAG